MKMNGRTLGAGVLLGVLCIALGLDRIQRAGAAAAIVRFASGLDVLCGRKLTGTHVRISNRPMNGLLASKLKDLIIDGGELTPTRRELKDNDVLIELTLKRKGIREFGVTGLVSSNFDGLALSGGAIEDNGIWRVGMMSGGARDICVRPK